MIKETTPRSWWANSGEPICVLLRAAFPSFHPGELVIGNVQKMLSHETETRSTKNNVDFRKNNWFFFKLKTSLRVLSPKSLINQSQLRPYNSYSIMYCKSTFFYFYTCVVALSAFSFY